MNTYLHLGFYNSAISILKQWLNNLVITKEKLHVNNHYHHKTVLMVKLFQNQYNSPNPHGSIDDITLYNILVRVPPKQIEDALINNSAFRNILENLIVPYDDEVHKGLTSILAMAAGFYYNDAEQIANNNVLTDYNERTQPMPTGAYDIASGANCERLKGWHFVTKERLNELNQDWRKDGDLGKLGVYLHAFQDSFSHKDFKTCAGQAFSSVDENGNVKTHVNIFNRDRWHEVDDPSKRPQLAFDMAKQSYDILIEALKIYLNKNSKKDKKSFFSNNLE